MKKIILIFSIHHSLVYCHENNLFFFFSKYCIVIRVWSLLASVYSQRSLLFPEWDCLTEESDLRVQNGPDSLRHWSGELPVRECWRGCGESSGERFASSEGGSFEAPHIRPGLREGRRHLQLWLQVFLIWYIICHWFVWSDLTSFSSFQALSQNAPVVKFSSRIVIYFVEIPKRPLLIRFYSSSGYFSVPLVVEGQWYDLSLATWEVLQDELRERFDSVLSALQRTEPGAR